MEIEIRGLPSEMKGIKELSKVLEVNLKKTASHIYRTREEEIFCNSTFKPFTKEIEKITVYIKGYKVATKMLCSLLTEVFSEGLKGIINPDKLSFVFEGYSEINF